MKTIFVDPSGSFNEGKGHTGIAYMKDDDWSTLSVESIGADRYTSRHAYWNAIIKRIVDLWTSFDDVVVIESFTIRSNGFLIGKMPETIQFIGALCWELEQYGIEYTFQTPSQAKGRFKDECLPNHIQGLERRPNGRYYLNGKQINDHVRDALKHLLYYRKYRESKT